MELSKGIVRERQGITKTPERIPFLHNGTLYEASIDNNDDYQISCESEKVDEDDLQRAKEFFEVQYISNISNSR